MHSCSVWTSSGINCPGTLLDAQEGLQDPFTEPEVPEDNRVTRGVPVVPPSRRHRKAENVNEALANFQLAVLMELGRQALVDEAIGRLPPTVRVPAEMVKEAYRQGARGKALALWVAAAAATLAVGLKFGPGAANAVGTLVSPRGAGFAMHFQAPKFEGVKKRVDRFIGSAQRGGAGFFPGILG